MVNVTTQTISLEIIFTTILNDQTMKFPPPSLDWRGKIFHHFRQSQWSQAGGEAV